MVVVLHLDDGSGGKIPPVNVSSATIGEIGLIAEMAVTCSAEPRPTGDGARYRSCCTNSSCFYRTFTL
jgi:hypothetical protein